MITVTEKAFEKIEQSIGGREGPQSIRVFRTEGDWKGPHLSMAFDDPKDDDQIITERGITFIIEKTLFDRAKPINIDYVESVLGPGFVLKSELFKDKQVLCGAICESC
ncbi:MAG TPA: hypothetical protein PLA81_07175 [Syntrophorhabdaceae bacterium]|nr:MAG: Iron-sulfur cluster insertion protein ErpA [Deltaproteobacteria bacterium ADurb.Bin026]HOF58019.1 hypothetical protein [Syntrophorhabdaceae bacterium]HOS05391.1 hypothetical protein [Syntrophorhabdaceae bacterium]HPL41355.1 hypothetical protein [Syntrophorhabdaceae bacterium]